MRTMMLWVVALVGFAVRTNGQGGCPDGYQFSPLGFSDEADGTPGHELTGIASSAQCGARCDGLPDCHGFEYNPGARRCTLKVLGRHSRQVQIAGWISCERAQVCDLGWTRLGDRCYMRQLPTDYDSASAACESRGAHLAVPGTAVENAFLASARMNPRRQPYTWLGFDYADAERWADGSPSSMSAGWRPLYAVDDAGDRASGEPVVFIRANGDWSFESKEYSYPFICEVGAGSSQLQIVNSTLHDRLDAALAGLREQQTGFANASSVAELGASLVDTEARISAALQSTATAQAAQLRAAADVLDGLSGRVAALEDMVQNVTSTVQNLTMTVAALLAPVVASASPTTGCGNLGGDGCQPRVQAVGLNVTLTGANVMIRSTECITTGAEMCEIKQTVAALVAKFRG